jgi:ferrochelatase
MIGGSSPLAERTEALRCAIRAALDSRRPGQCEVVVGLKHAAPRIEDGIERLAGAGVSEVVGLVLAPHYSDLSVGQYLERAEAAGREHDVAVLSVRSWHLLPAYLDFLAAAVRARLAELPAATLVVFTAHSLPARILATKDPYPEQLAATASAVAARAGLPTGTWRTAWQSASPTPEPWLTPDVLSLIDDAVARDGLEGILVCACGFVSDHLEILYDLDVVARGRAAAGGLAFARTASVNADAAVMAALAELVLDRAGAR